MRILFLVLTLTLCFSLSEATYAEELNAGFVQGLWYSNDQVFVDEPVRIYAALRNNTEHDLSGTVRFIVDGERIETKAISALPGRLVEAWADWVPTYGEHTIAATLSDIKLHTVGEGIINVEVVSALAEDMLVVDYDTDGDGIGNEEDLDDDNDNRSDEDEKDAGTDPLVYNEPDETEPDETEEEAPVENTEEEEHTDDADANNQEQQTSAEEQSPEGFEKYLGDGTTNAFLSTVTEKIHTTKSSLDTYREVRTEERERQKQNTLLEMGGIPRDSEEYTASSSEDMQNSATITRTHREEKPGFVKLVIQSFFALLGGLYTFILWFISGVLGYPALVQLVLLFGILFVIYRIAKRLGRRPDN